MLQSSLNRSAASEHVDVLIVGAGLSGIDAAYRLQTGSPDRRYTLFEARDAIGGTWDLFRYPGIRSDSDMVTLGFPFRPWRDDKTIVDGGDIRDYIVDTAREYGIDKQIRFRHRVVSAAWSTAEHLWTVDYDADGERRQIRCDFLFMCSGYYDYAQGYAPSWPGMEEFGGRIVHPQFWPDDLDVKDQRVVVIGSGATAITLIPSLAARGTRSVTMLQRSPTYIISRPARDKHAKRLRERLPQGLADSAIRWKNIMLSTFFYTFARKRPERLKELIRTRQSKALGPDFDMAHLTPSYQPWDQRMCLVPDGDLFRSLKSGEAEIVTDQIERFTADGITLKSGKTLPADIVVSATGLRMQMLGGMTLSVDGEAVDPATRMLYKGAMLSGVPNFAFAVGYTNASWTLKCDITSRYVSRLLNHMRRNKQSMVVPEAPADAHADEAMIGLNSGYVQRAASTLPRQGKAAPWRVNQNYAKDLAAFKLGRIRDEFLRLEKRVVKAIREAA